MTSQQTTADYRMNRPVYQQEEKLNLLIKLHNPQNRIYIKKVLLEYPEIIETLEKMICEALLLNSNIDYYRMSSATHSNLQDAAKRLSKKIIRQIKK